MHEMENGHYSATVSMSPELAMAISRTVKEHPELTQSRLFREAVRKELQRYEINDDFDL